jgi:hypothetical protein
MILDYERIKNRTPAELEAENSWWGGLSEEQRRTHLDRWRKEDRDRESFKVVVALIVFAALIALPGLLGCIELAKKMFN